MYQSPIFRQPLQQINFPCDLNDFAEKVTKKVVKLTKALPKSEQPSSVIQKIESKA